MALECWESGWNLNVATWTSLFCAGINMHPGPVTLLDYWWAPSVTLNDAHKSCLKYVELLSRVDRVQQSLACRDAPKIKMEQHTKISNPQGKIKGWMQKRLHCLWCMRSHHHPVLKQQAHWHRHHPPHDCIDFSLITPAGDEMGHFPGKTHTNIDT